MQNLAVGPLPMNGASADGTPAVDCPGDAQLDDVLQSQAM